MGQTKCLSPRAESLGLCRCLSPPWTSEVSMLVPMVLLILPITVIFAIYPGIQALEIGL